MVLSLVALSCAFTTNDYAQEGGWNDKVLLGMRKVYLSVGASQNGFTDGEAKKIEAKVRAGLKQRKIQNIDDPIVAWDPKSGSSTLGIRLIRMKRGNVVSLLVTICTQDIAEVNRNGQAGLFHTWENSFAAITDTSDRTTIYSLTNQAVTKFWTAWDRVNR